MRSIGARTMPRRASIQKFFASRVGLPPALNVGSPLSPVGNRYGCRRSSCVATPGRVGAEADLEGVEDALDQAVEAELGKARAVGLHADPVIVVEDVGLLAVPVDEVDALAAETRSRSRG
jgi:hypothetical protein